MTLKNALFALFLLTVSGLSPAAPGSDDLRAYRLNLILFEHLSENSDEQVPLRDHPVKPAFDRVILPDTPLMENQIQINEDTEFDLADSLIRLQRSRRYRVLWSGSVTLVMLPDTEHHLSLTGPLNAQGIPQFEAVVDFRRSLYLHAGVTLNVPQWSPWSHVLLDTVLPPDRSVRQNGYPPYPAPLPDIENRDRQLTGWITLEQAQRLKIGVTTYYDHPRYSALVRVERAELPAPEQVPEAGTRGDVVRPLSAPPVPLSAQP